MVNKKLEDEQLKLVQRLVQHANKPTLNQYRILFEKCLHTSHRIWTTLEFFIPFLLTIIVYFSIMRHLTNQGQNKIPTTYPPAYQQTDIPQEHELKMRLGSHSKNYYMIKSTANSELVDIFIDYVERRYNHCG